MPKEPGQPLEIGSISVPFFGIEEFVVDARLENYEFVDRLISEWESGIEGFEGSGAAFLAVKLHGKVIAVGGIAADQYRDDPTIGRLKHVYVLQEFRRMGVAWLLVENLLCTASDSFKIVRLRVANDYAAKLYEQFGFVATDSVDASHILELN